MSNPSKQKGTEAETAVLRVIRTILNAPESRSRRMTLAGHYDLGDVHVEMPDGIVRVFEVKAGKQADDASLGQIAAWQLEAETEAANAKGLPVLVVKRRGIAPERAALWRAFMQLESPASDRNVWVEMPLYMLLEWIADVHGRYPHIIAA